MNQYEIIKRMAPALYGDVLLCKDKNSSEYVAVKRMDLRHAKNNVTLKGKHSVMEDVEVERQANIVFRKNGGHDNVLNMRQDFIENGKLHFVFDYCKNGELYDMVSKQPEGKFDEQTAKEYFRQIAKGVKYMHSCGYAHRDLSLENVLVDANGTLKVCDFGLVTSTMKQSKQSVGKLFYMAPEVYQRKVYSPVAADTWSLGAILFIMLTGIPPVEKSSPSDSRFRVIHQHGIRKLVDVWEMSSWFSEEAMDLLSKLLVSNPSSRSTIDEILSHPWIAEPEESPVDEENQSEILASMASKHRSLRTEQVLDIISGRTVASMCKKLVQKAHLVNIMKDKKQPNRFAAAQA